MFLIEKIIHDFHTFLLPIQAQIMCASKAIPLVTFIATGVDAENERLRYWSIHIWGLIIIWTRGPFDYSNLNFLFCKGCFIIRLLINIYFLFEQKCGKLCQAGKVPSVGLRQILARIREKWAKAIFLYWWLLKILNSQFSGIISKYEL